MAVKVSGVGGNQQLLQMLQLINQTQSRREAKIDKKIYDEQNSLAKLIELADTSEQLNNINYNWHVQLDDDSLSFHMFEKLKKRTFIDQDKIHKIIDNQFNLCDGWGLKVWGFALAADYKFY